jgi:hypothetical protein
MTDRRYDDEEIAEIFRKAAEGPQALLRKAGGSEGMTLAELQDIGREAGLSPEAVESAARSLELRPQAGVRRYLALPIQVERSVELPRKVTEAEWERLVVQLRETFNARGVVSVERIVSSVDEWQPAGAARADGDGASPAPLHDARELGVPDEHRRRHDRHGRPGGDCGRHCGTPRRHVVGRGDAQHVGSGIASRLAGSSFPPGRAGARSRWSRLPRGSRSRRVPENPDGKLTP